MSSLFIRMDPVFSAIQKNLNSALSIPFVSSAVTLGLAFYAYKAGPELPSFMEELFLNVFFRVFIGFMVLYMGTGNVLLSLVVSVVFIYGVGMLSGLKEGLTFGPGGPFSGPSFGDYSGFPIALPSGDVQKVWNILTSRYTPDAVAERKRRHFLFEDARTSDLSKDEKTAFKSNLSNIGYLVEDYFKGRYKDVLNVFKHDENVKNFMCSPLLIKRLKEGVIYPTNKNYVTQENMELIGTKEDIDDAKKIRLARLFKDYIKNQPTNIDDKKNFFNMIYTGFDSLIKRDDISKKYKKIFNDYNENAKKGIEPEYCPWHDYDSSITSDQR